MSTGELQTHSEYIQAQGKIWVDKFSSFIRGKTLKIGNGLGHTSELIRPFAESLSIVEIAKFPGTINENDVQLYDGVNLPFKDKAFETTIIILTLHHIPQSRLYFKELLRVTSKRVIILEETYDNLFQKIHLVYRDWQVNKGADQSSKLYWGSYFSRKQLNNLFKENNLKEVYKFTKKHKSYYKELVVLDL